jgi:DNA-binding response OmpR family regulator
MTWSADTVSWVRDGEGERRTMARIYVIEDDPAVRGEVEILLERAGHEAVCASDFTHVAADALAASPDLVLLDLGLPGTDGLIVARELRQSSDVPVIVLTSRTTDVDELMSMSMGADAFIEKPYNGQVLLAHIDAVLRRAGRAAAASRTMEHKGLTLDLSRSTACFQGRTAELTKNELRILETLMRRAGQVVSREELMEALWSTDSFVDDNTLTVNVNRLRQTLARIGVTDFVVTRRGQGYVV